MIEVNGLNRFRLGKLRIFLRLFKLFIRDTILKNSNKQFDDMYFVN